VRTMSHFRCPRCSFTYPDDGQVYLWPNVGTGTTWHLYKCPGCERLFACEMPGGYIPEAAKNDPTIEVVEFKDLTAPGTR